MACASVRKCPLTSAGRHEWLRSAEPARSVRGGRRSKMCTLADRVGILDGGRLIALAPADELKAQYGGETLEEAFFSATGKAFEDEKEKEDDD